MAFKRTILGGTFDSFHKGHEDLLARAFNLSDSVVIGISSDQFAQRFRSGKIEPYKTRRDMVTLFCKNLEKDFKTIEINDFYGPSTTDPDLDAIFVSEETSLRAKEINAVRVKKGLEKLTIVEVPFTLAADRRPISSERIRNGEIDRDGNLAE